MKNLITLILMAALMFAFTSVLNANTKQEIKKANQKGNIVFLVVTEKGNSKNQEALNLAKSAQTKVQKSSVLEFDRNNMADYELVKEYGLAGAPAPLILVITTNGFVAGGGLLANLSTESLIKMIPTPKEELVIKSLNEGNSVFVVFSKKTESKNKKQLDACQTACQNMNDKAKTVNVDIDDTKEKTFISKFTFDKSSELPVTFVINTQGQVTSSFKGVTEINNLIAAAQKKASSCGTGSSCGTSCGPTQK